MAETIKRIFEIDGGKSIETLRQLRQQADEMANKLDEVANISGEWSAEYQQQLVITKRAQKDYNEAMNLTVNAANATKTSYYDLNKQLVEARKQWKNLSAEERAADANLEDGLLKTIDRLDKELKDLDKSIGQNQRNVGDYAAQFKAAFEGAELSSTGLGKAIKNVDASARLFSTNPVMGVLTLLLPLITSITSKVKESEAATASFQSIGKSLQPILDLGAKVIEKIVGLVGNLADKFVEVAGESGETFKKIIAGAVGVGNTIGNFLLFPIRQSIAAFKGLGNIIGDVFKGNFKQIKTDAAEAFNGIEDAFKRGISFKQNFELGKAAGEQFAAGLGTAKKKVSDEAAGVVEAVEEELLKLTQIQDAWYEKTDNQISEIIRKAKEAADDQKLLEQQMAEFEKGLDAELAEAFAANPFIDAQAQKAEAMKDFVTKMNQYSKAVTSIATSVAAAWQSEIQAQVESGKIGEKEAEKQFKNVKALQSAATVINTFAGVTQALSDPSVPSYVLRAINAAATLTSGLASVSQINKTTMSSSGTIATAQTPQNIVAAPTIIAAPQVTRTLTTASDEERLNRESKVYVVASEVEAVQNGTKARVAEATF